MKLLQLELDLWQQLAEAQQSPQQVDWQQLCLAFDQTIALTPVNQQLVIAGAALFEMAEVLAVRAEEMWSGWGRSDDDGPVLVDDVFFDLVRQSLSLDLSDLVSVPELYVRSSLEVQHGDGETMVEYREKEVVLAELESVVEDEGEGAIEGLEYDEDVSGWAETMREWLKKHNCTSAALVELERSTGLSMVQLWLAGLLGGFKVWQERGFYEGEGITLQIWN